MSLFDQVSSPYGVGAAPFRSPVVIQPNDSVLSAVSRGGVPINAYINNEGIGNSITVAGALSSGSDGGNQSSPANGTEFGSGFGGGNGAVGGVGGANVNSVPGAVGDVTLAAKAPAANLQYQGSVAVPQYAG